MLVQAAAVALDVGALGRRAREPAEPAAPELAAGLAEGFSAAVASGFSILLQDPGPEPVQEDEPAPPDEPVQEPQEPPAPDPVEEAAGPFREASGPVHDPTRCPYCYQRLPPGYLTHDHGRYPAVAADLGLRIATSYVYRGVPLVDDTVLQGETSVSIALDEEDLVAVTAWGNVDLHDDAGMGLFSDGNDGKLTEIDLSVEYVRSAGPVWASIGVVSRSYPNVPPRATTTEVVAGFGGDHLALRAHVDVQEIEGVYLNGVAEGVFRLSDELALEASLSLGWADEDMGMALYGLPESGLADLHAAAALRYDLTEHTAVRLSVHGSTLLDDDLGERLERADFDTDQAWGTIGIAWSF